MIKFLIGGSPCTNWSIAQTQNRETKPEGIGWELFVNYLIAHEKFKPDFFLYENNKSAAQLVKDQISKELGTPLQYINSGLVSAQNRQRFYGHNFGNVPQPEDRGILLRDVLENGIGIPVNTTADGKAQCLRATCYKDGIRNLVANDVDRRTCVAEPIKIGEINKGGQGDRIYSIEGKAVSLTANGGGAGSNTGLYAIPYDGGAGKPVYCVENGFVTFKDKQYPIKLPDGYYIIRKLTITESCRLQTLPDDYCCAVSNSQAYKGLGNGWTAEVIIHLLSHALRGVPKDEHIAVLSMYDGIGTGRYCFDKLGYKNITYYAYEIDKYAMTVAKSNYWDIVQCGDAFDVRRADWFMRGMVAV